MGRLRQRGSARHMLAASAAVAAAVAAATVATGVAAEVGWSPVTMTIQKVTPDADRWLRAHVPNYDPAFPTSVWVGTMKGKGEGATVMLVAGTSTCERDEHVGQTCPLLVTRTNPGGVGVVYEGMACSSPGTYAESSDGRWLRVCDRDIKVFD